MPSDEAYREVLRRLDELSTKQREITMENEVAELSVTREGVSLKSAALNTLLTLIGVLLSGATAMGMYMHYKDTQTGAAAFVGALKEQTQVQREQTTVMRESNCLQTYQGPASTKAEFCNRVTR